MDTYWSRARNYGTVPAGWTVRENALSQAGRTSDPYTPSQTVVLPYQGGGAYGSYGNRSGGGSPTDRLARRTRELQDAAKPPTMPATKKAATYSASKGATTGDARDSPPRAPTKTTNGTWRTTSRRRRSLRRRGARSAPRAATSRRKPCRRVRRWPSAASTTARRPPTARA